MKTLSYPASVDIKRGDVISVIQSYEVEATSRRSGRTFKIQFDVPAAQPTLRRPIGVALNDAKPGQRVEVMMQGAITGAPLNSQISPVYMDAPPIPDPEVALVGILEALPGDLKHLIRAHSRTPFQDNILNNLMGNQGQED